MIQGLELAKNHSLKVYTIIPIPPIFAELQLKPTQLDSTYPLKIARILPGMAEFHPNQPEISQFFSEIQLNGFFVVLNELRPKLAE
jgi:hypothetical protein